MIRHPQFATTAILSLACLAGTTYAQSGVYSSGIMHTPSGQATLGQGSGRRIPVSNLGSTGQDGVEVNLNSIYGGTVDIDATPLFALSGTQRSIACHVKAFDGSTPGSMSLRVTPDGFIHGECDLSDTGAVAVEMTFEDIHGNVIDTEILDSFPVRWSSPELLATQNVTFGMGAGKVNFSDLSVMCRCPRPLVIVIDGPFGPITIPNTFRMRWRPILCITEPCPGNPTTWPNLRSLAVTATNVPDLIVSNSSFDWSWGASNPSAVQNGGGQLPDSVLAWGTGQAHLTEQIVSDVDGDGLEDRALHCDILSSSGLDGVKLEWRDPKSSYAYRLANNKHPDLMRFTDDQGTEMRVYCDTNPFACSVTIFPDCASVGPAVCVVECRDASDNVLCTRTLPQGQTFSYTSCPTQPNESDEVGVDFKSFPFQKISFNVPLQEVRFSSGFIQPGVSSITLSPLSVYKPFGLLSSCTMTSRFGVLDVVTPFIPQSRTIGGCIHVPHGGTVTRPPVERSLPVHNLGSSGLDGVEVFLGSQYGGQVTCDTTELRSPSPFVKRIRAIVRGWDLKTKAVLTSSSTSSNDIAETCDFSSLGSGAVELTCVDSSGATLDSATFYSSNVSWTASSFSPPFEQTKTRMGAGKVSVSDFTIMKAYSLPTLVRFDTPTGIHVVQDVAQVLCHPICIVSPCPGDWTNLSSITIDTTNLPDLEVSNAAFDYSWGVSNPSSSGSGGLSAGRVLISTAPASGGTAGGNDGGGSGGLLVEHTINDVNGDGLSDIVATCSHRSAGDSIVIDLPRGEEGLSLRKTGHVSLIKQRTAAGVEARLSHAQQGCSSSYSPDFSSLGADECTVVCSDQSGTPLFSSTMFLDETAAVQACDSLRDAKISCSRTGGDGAPAYTVEFTSLELVSFSWGDSVNNVASVTFSPINPTVSFGPIVQCVISEEDPSQASDITIADLHIIEPPITCDSIDFNADGIFPDDTDVADFLSVFAGGTCSTNTCSDIDFNNDGIFPDDTDVASFLSVFAGGAC